MISDLHKLLIILAVFKATKDRGRPGWFDTWYLISDMEVSLSLCKESEKMWILWTSIWFIKYDWFLIVQTARRSWTIVGDGVDHRHNAAFSGVTMQYVALSLSKLSEKHRESKRIAIEVAQVRDLVLSLHHRLFLGIYHTARRYHNTFSLMTLLPSLSCCNPWCGCGGGICGMHLSAVVGSVL